MAAMLTDLELARSAFPGLPFRLSQRRSKSITNPIAPRSYEDLRRWPMFTQGAAAMAQTLDNQVQRNAAPLTTIDPLDEAADEVGVRVPLEAHIFPQTNRLAARVGLVFRYKQGGSGRSFSFTDLVILDSSHGQPAGDRKQLSMRVYGNGEAKGNWQCTLEGFPNLDAALRDQKNGDRLKQVIQQLFGDMVLDEAKYGFITEYNYTVFFRRVAGTKILEYSPIVQVSSAPIEKFLFVLSRAEADKNLKPSFSRLAVQDTPPGGYRILLPQQQTVTRSGRSSKRPLQFIQVGVRPSKRRKRAGAPDGDGDPEDAQEVYDEQDLDKVPTYRMNDLGITGSVIGMGKYGNVIEGRHPVGTKLALKLFDLRKEEAASAVVREQKAYQRLKPLQGSHLPRLLAVGRIPHTSMVFLALTDEASCDVVQLLQGRDGHRVERSVLQCLSEIHACGVLHNDIKLSHVLWNHQAPKFIDFDASIVAGSRDEQMSELTLLEEVLAEARNHEL